MKYDPKLRRGQIITNEHLMQGFRCGNMGGMRRSKTTGTLVIVADHTKTLYKDYWHGDVLHYTGMGKNGPQDIAFAQNKTLAESHDNGVDVHLFEVFKRGQYSYVGRVVLAGQPYQEDQKGEDGMSRKVWMFPVRPLGN